MGYERSALGAAIRCGAEIVVTKAAMDSTARRGNRATEQDRRQHPERDCREPKRYRMPRMWHPCPEEPRNENVPFPAWGLGVMKTSTFKQDYDKCHTYPEKWDIVRHASAQSLVDPNVAVTALYRGMCGAAAEGRNANGAWARG